MKTKSSTTWCNLYLSESKYKLTFYPSKLEKKLTWLSFALSFCGVLYLVIYSTYFLLPFALLGFIFISLWLIHQNKLNECINSLVLLPQGRLIFNRFSVQNNDEFLLLARSRVGWLGCWLIYADPEQLKNTQQCFIFNDQLSRRDYSRLCRWVFRYESAQ